MKKNILCAIYIALALPAFAKVEPQLENLRDTQFQCDVAYAQETRNGKVIRQTKNSTESITTFNQDGGEQYTDAKCFIVPVVDDTGADTVMGFGCIEIDSKRVQQFDNKKLVITRKEYRERIEIDFLTGIGSQSFHFSGCDWGRKCVDLVGEVQYKNCKIQN